MSRFSDWGDCLEPLLRDARFRAELLDQLEDDGERLVAALVANKPLSEVELEKVDEALREAYDFLAEQVVCLDWYSCSPMGGDGASWILGFADVYWFCSSDWENQGPFESLGNALDASSSFSMATENASLKSSHVSDDTLLSIAESVCPYDSTIYVNGTEYRHGEDGLVSTEDDEEGNNNAAEEEDDVDEDDDIDDIDEDDEVDEDGEEDADED